MAYTQPALKLNANTYETIAHIVEEQRLSYRKENTFLDYDIEKRRDYFFLSVNISSNKQYKYSEAYFKIDKATGIVEYVLPRNNYKTKRAFLHNLWDLEEHLAILFNSLTIKK